MEPKKEIEMHDGKNPRRRAAIEPSCSVVVVPVLGANGYGHISYMDSGLKTDDGIEIWTPQVRTTQSDQRRQAAGAQTEGQAMLKANRVNALGLPLADGGQALMVQEGPEWNGLRKFKCIAPPQLDGQTIIAAKDNEGSPMAAAFGRLFDMDDSERWVVVMTSPELGERLQR